MNVYARISAKNHAVAFYTLVCAIAMKLLDFILRYDLKLDVLGR